MKNNGPKNKKLICLADVSMTRGGAKVLDGISWEMRSNEHWFILGENGSGKTTLLEIIAGYLWPQNGTVHVLGRRYGGVDIRQLRTKIGYVSPWIFNRMDPNLPLSKVVASGRDASVGFWGEISPSLQRKVKRSLSIFGIQDLYDRKFGACSSGQQFRAILARAHVNAPKVLILDEPFAQMDIGTRLLMYGHLKELCKRASAPQIMMVTHHLEDIQPLFTHGMIIKKGKVLRQGRRGDILDPKFLRKALSCS